MSVEGIDELDVLPTSVHVSWLDFVLLIYSVIIHFFDMGYDIYIAYSYFITEMYSYFAWTLVFIAIPTVIITLISIKMYMTDSEESSNYRFAFIRILLCTFGAFLQSALPIRYCDSFWYGVKSVRAERKSRKQEQQKFFKKMMSENSDAALLRVFECYTESALQQVLQITLMLLSYIKGDTVHIFKQCITITSCFVSMGSCMAVYHRCIRYDQSNKKNISLLGSVFQFLWHLNFTVSRILALSALATLFPLWAFIGGMCHWMAMTIWVDLTNENHFCGRNKFLELLFSAAVGLIYVFNFVSVKDGPTRNHYTAFYLICFLENAFAVIIWGIEANTVLQPWLYYIFLICPVVTFVLSITCMLVYYRFLHPNKTLVRY